MNPEQSQTRRALGGISGESGLSRLSLAAQLLLSGHTIESVKARMKVDEEILREVFRFGGSSID